MKPIRMIPKPYKIYVVSDDGWASVFTGTKRMTPAEARTLAANLNVAANQMEARNSQTA